MSCAWRIQFYILDFPNFIAKQYKIFCKIFFNRNISKPHKVHRSSKPQWFLQVGSRAFVISAVWMQTKTASLTTPPTLLLLLFYSPGFPRQINEDRIFRPRSRPRSSWGAEPTSTICTSKDNACRARINNATVNSFKHTLPIYFN